MDISGKRAIVLGGTSGIGLSAVQQLADAGAQVLACGRSQDNIDRASAVTGDSVTYASLDVQDVGAMSDLFSANAGFDILVNAATGGPRASGPFLNMELDGFKGSFAKLWGYVHSVHTGVPHMAEDGCVVLVSGYPARKCGPGMSAISTVGNAVEGFVRAMATELAPRRINVVSPGLIDTPMFPGEGQARDTMLEKASSKFLIPRPGRADEVASAIVFLVQNDYMTGSTIDVEGGALLP